MYLEFYGLSEKPFSQTPDPRFLYWNDGNRETLASLTYGIRERKGFLTMIGEAGTGKTTLLRKLLDDLGSEVLSVFLFNPNVTFEEILEYTLSELGIPVPSGRKLAMLQRLNEFLLAAFAEGRNTILVIDEAQDLDADVLESLRLLSNLETSQEKILQIVLSGQPELAARLAEPGLRQLKQRIAVRCRLEPLQREELAEYVGARLAVSGGRPDLFAGETLDPIWCFAQGIPRLINMACDNALLVGYALGRRTIDRAVVDEVVADLRRLDVDFAPADSSTSAPVGGVEAGTPAPAALPVAAATGLDSGVSTPSIPAPSAPAPSAAGATRQETSRPPSPGAETLAPGGMSAAPTNPPPRAVAAPVSPPPRPAAAPRAPEAEPQRGQPGLRWIAAAGAAIVLLALGGALTLWAERSLNADPPRLESEIAGGPRSPVRPEPDALPDGESPAKESEDPSVAQVPPSGAASLAEAPQAIPHHAGEPAPDAADPDAADEQLAEPDPSERRATQPAHATAKVDPREDTATAAEEPESAVEPIAPAVAAVPDLEGPEPRAAVVEGAEPGDPGSAAGADAAKLVQVRSGDTLSILATRAYGRANLTTLDMLRSRNPGIADIDLIVAGERLEFPDPGPTARLLQGEGGLAVLVLTTDELVEALAMQETLEQRFALPVDLKPMELGRRRDLYRVSIRAPGEQKALEIASNLGSILEDPGT
jgi:general secretion pathway protein A